MSIRTQLEDAARASAAFVGQKASDYIGEDGLLYCGLCHTPKQVEISFCGSSSPSRVFCMCECMDREEREREERTALREKASALRASAFPDDPNGEEMQRWTFENDRGTAPKIMAFAKNYADNFDTMKKDKLGVLFFGKVGRGKTYAAVSIANALLDRGIPVYATSFSRIADESQNSFQKRQEYFDGMTAYPLLVIDDLGSERDTAYMKEVVYKVIDMRDKRGLPVIVTTNFNGAAIKHHTDPDYERIFSRLKKMCIPFEASGDDLREEILKTNYKKYKSLLDRRGENR